MMQMILNKCKCGGDPVEQTRGQMKPEDHHRQYNRYVAVAALAMDHGVMLDVDDFRRAAYDVEESDPEHAHDIRISCPDCGNATGWDRRDIEEYRNHGLADNRRYIIVRDGNMDNIRNRWNDANPVK